MTSILHALYLTAFLLFGFPSCDDVDSGTIHDNLPDISGYPIVSTNQTKCFNDYHEIAAPVPGEPFYGQDAQYPGNLSRYLDNGDSTITDRVTGLMWEQAQSKMLWKDAESNAANAGTGGYSDWRVPTIKELYSLIDFTGNQGTGDPSSLTPPPDAKPFINTDYFAFEYPSAGRYIDVQMISKTTYLGTAIGNEETFFGLNLADGRIKAYPHRGNLSSPEFAARFVRGNENYGINSFQDNGDGTITDLATGLMWCKYDSGDETFAGTLSGYSYTDGSMNWEEALHFSENATFAGYGDWRLPDAKELHSILDYSRSPDATDSPAIDPVFETTGITNEAGEEDFPAFWSSTTFEPGRDAVIIFFGRAMGYFDPYDPMHNSHPIFLDVHGAGCQRTDPKSGTPDYGHGPQGDVRRVYNYVRLVRNP